MTESLRIRYKSKTTLFYIFSGVLMLILSFLGMYLSETNELSGAFIGIGLLHLLQGVYYLKAPYLKVENGLLSKHELLVYKQKLDEIIGIKKFTDEYTFKTAEKEIILNHNMMHKEDKEKFFDFVKKLQDEVEKRKG